MKAPMNPYQEFFLGTCGLITSTYLIRIALLFTRGAIEAPFAFGLPASILLYALYIHHKIAERASWHEDQSGEMIFTIQKDDLRDFSVLLEKLSAEGYTNVRLVNTVFTIHEDGCWDFCALLKELSEKGYTLEDIERLLVWFIVSAT
jgi:hypothetical protein